MEELTALLVVALFAERLVEALKMVLGSMVQGWPRPYQESFWRLLGLFWGVLLAVALKVNLFVIAGLPDANPVLGALLAGLFAGMGTEWVHQLLTNLPRLSAEARRLRLLTGADGAGRKRSD
ncbi:MAG: hypothetical protein QHH27_09515 [Clostridia bacterium]|jgi:fructose-specific phosphotransferase system IIC component|nr:hypothetical protein [Clostridia bacterium]MDH7573768.1 hypothetical protein [Clostridia bacterium]